MMRIISIKSISKKSAEWMIFVISVLFASTFSASTQASAFLDDLSPKEQQWLIDNPVIKLGIDRAFPPFGSITEDNEYIGFTADYMDLISSKLGIEFEILKDASWNETIDLAKSGKIDMIAGLVNTAERQDYLHFSPSYVKTPTIIFNDGLKNGYFGTLEKLKDKTVAVEQGSFASVTLSKEYPTIKQLHVENTELALSIVAANRADAYIGNAAAGSYLIKKLGLNNLFYSGTTPYYSNHSIGITRPNKILESIINKALASIDQPTRDAIAEKWFGMQIHPQIRRSTAIGLTIAGVIALILLATWINILYRTRKALRTSEGLVRHQANIDSLTGLINRRYMYDILSAETSEPSAKDNEFALLFLDLDEFKEVNDTLGHNIGDELLKSVAERLQNCVRISDTVGRLGGDEFTIILQQVSQKSVIEQLAKKICKSLSTEFRIQGHSINVSTSIGITRFPQDAATADDLLINADQAMYACKNNGRNGYSFFNDAMREAMVQRNQILQDLKLATLENQLALYYQPIINLASGEITKVEALVRWKHPARGLVSPDSFIQLAEESGQINDIGEWVFKNAANQIAEWRNKYSTTLQVSINTSPLQYRDNGIDIQSWCAYLGGLGLSGQAIIVEITEGLLMESSAAVKEKLWGLRDAGIEVAIDDFGTGYSSLSYMKKFDIDYLKIDQSFVANLATDSEDSALCEAISVMAHKLGCRVVAEGIETQEQSRLLLEAGCDYGQGYLYSKPIPAAQLTELLKQSAYQRNTKPSLEAVFV